MSLFDSFESDNIWLHLEEDQWIRKYSRDFYAEIKRKNYNQYVVCYYYQNCEIHARTVLPSIEKAKEWAEESAIPLKNKIKTIKADMISKNKKHEVLALRMNEDNSTTNWEAILLVIAAIIGGGMLFAYVKTPVLIIVFIFVMLLICLTK